MSVGTPLLSPDEQVSHLQRAVAQGDQEIESVVTLLPKVLETGAWAQFTDMLGNTVEHPSFQSFVTTPRYKGLGIKDGREALVGWIKPASEEIAELAERAWKGEVPAARKSAGRPAKDELNTGGTSIYAEQGLSADSILARLKRDHPELAQQVVDGTATANAAATQLGWRKPRILLTSPEHVATKLFDHWTGEQITELIELLQEGA